MFRPKPITDAEIRRALAESEYMPSSVAGYVAAVYRLTGRTCDEIRFWHKYNSVLRDLFDWGWFPSEAAKFIKGESL